MTVRARVVNLTTLRPEAGLNLGLDTNILFWLGYGRATQDPDVRQRARPYTSFIGRGLAAGVKFHCTTLSLIEAMHKIEQVEYRLANPGAPMKEIKAFREIQANRDLVGAQIDAFWASMKNTASILPAQIDEAVVSRMLSNQRSGELDAYDMGIIESCSAANITSILTDDRDFATYDNGVVVVTANPNCLRIASDQGMVVPFNQPESESLS